jgi:hypothetical protein
MRRRGRRWKLRLFEDVGRENDLREKETYDTTVDHGAFSLMPVALNGSPKGMLTSTRNTSAASRSYRGVFVLYMFLSEP